jgi:hypothetical protein
MYTLFNSLTKIILVAFPPKKPIFVKHLLKAGSG